MNINKAPVEPGAYYHSIILLVTIFSYISSFRAPIACIDDLFFEVHDFLVTNSPLLVTSFSSISMFHRRHLAKASIVMPAADPLLSLPHLQYRRKCESVHLLCLILLCAQPVWMHVSFLLEQKLSFPPLRGFRQV